MNGLRYRIIFNPARAISMVVADIAGTGRGRVASRQVARGYPREKPLLSRLPRLGFCLLLAISGVSFSAQGRIVAHPDAPGAQQPVIINAANGVTQVDIQTPNAAGVSHNVYSEFNVEPRGVVLNNSHEPIQSQLAGYVMANPHLAGGAATVILNEVNSENPSLLNGWIEVAGQHAQVVIANPAGISCDGCGFINAYHPILTTGQVLMDNDGRLSGFDVDRGDIEFKGKGADFSQADQASIIARAVRINAKVHAGELNLVTGRNVTDADGNIVRVKHDDASERVEYALDTAAIGGMYARKIRMIGTEHGVGVRHAGEWGALAGGITVTAHGRVENTTSGKMLSRGDLRLTSAQDVDNHGKLDAHANIHLHAAGRLENSDEISASGSVTLTADRVFSGAKSQLSAGLDNVGNATRPGSLTVTAHHSARLSGKNRANARLQVSSPRVDLTGSEMQARDIRLTARVNPGVSTGGLALNDTHISADAITLYGERQIDHQHAQLIAQRLTLDTPLLDNSHGLIYQAGPGALRLALDSLDNSSGKIGNAGSHLFLSARRVDNPNGLIFCDQSLVGTYTSLNNHQGRITGTSQLALTGQAVNNAAGLIASAGDITLDTQGQPFDNLNGRVLGAGVRLTSGSLNNQGGHWQSTGHLDINVGDASIDNRDGILDANRALTLRAGNVHNQQGRISMGQQGELTLRRLSGVGQLRSSGDLTLGLQDDLHNDGDITALGQLQISTAQDLFNHRPIKDSQSLTVKARNLTNSPSGELDAGSAHIHLQETVNNTGTLNGGLVHIVARTLNNHGTGRIYGDHITIALAILHNIAEESRAPVIAARQRLDLGIGKLRNRDQALIYSQGDLVIGGALDANHQAIGRATLVHNHGAEISSEANLTLNAETVRNTNGGLISQTVVSRLPRFHELVLNGDTVRYPWAEVNTNKSNKYGVHTAILPSGQQSDRFNEYRYDRTLTETKVKQTHPGKILAAGDLTLNADKVTNHDSMIDAGGTLGGDSGEVRNIATQGQRVTRDIGRKTHWYPKKKRKKIGGTITSQGKDSSPYRPAPMVETLDLDTVTYRGHSQPNSTAVVIDEHRGVVIGVLPEGVSAHDDGWAVGRQPATARRGRLLGRPKLADAPDVVDYAKGVNALPPVTFAADRPCQLLPGQLFELSLPPLERLGRTITPAVRTLGLEINLPQNSLYILHSDSRSTYVVETDPRFTQYKQWLGTDYMQHWLRFEPNAAHKRLGDGFYEQRLVRDQILQLTGQRFLGGHNNDHDQLKALMDAGIAFAQQHPVAPGVALSPGQMALLTTDMVWLVNQSLTLPDGRVQEVLVPQVYARVGQGDLTGDGALLSGRNIALHATGDVDNSGHIIAVDRADLTLDNVFNSGFIEASKLDIRARHDISNRGGQMRTQHGLSLTAGGDITAASTLGTDGVNRWIDRHAGLKVLDGEGELSLRAGNDITLTAASVSHGGIFGRTTFDAGRDLSFTTLTRVHQERDHWGHDIYRYLDQQSDHGTTLDAAGDVNLRAGRDAQFTAAGINADGQLALQAGRDISLEAGTSTYELTEYQKQSSSNALSSMSIETLDWARDRRALGSTLSGEAVTLRAGRDLQIDGSNLAGTGDVNLTAGRHLTLSTAREEHDERHYRLEQNAGVMGSGGVGVSCGSNSLEITDVTQVRQHLSSMVGSAQGNARLTAGERLQIAGSDAIAGGDLALTGGDITVRAVENTFSHRQTINQQQSGFTLALSGTVGAAINSAVESAQQAKAADNDRVAALHKTKAALAGVQAVQAGLLSAAQGDAAQNNNAIGISLSYGSQSARSERRQEQHVAQGSSLGAGHNITLNATGQIGAGDIVIHGSQLQAANEIALAAERDIHLLSALNTETLKGENSSQGGTVGIGIGVGSGGWGISVFASINKGRGHESGDSLVHTNTLLDAGKQVSLNSRRDARLSGAQVSGETIKARVGRDLLMVSQQDSDRYDALQENASAGASFTFGSMTGSASVNLSRDKMHSNFDSVIDQTGLYAGKGGFDVYVGEHSQLDGAVLASTAAADHNRFDTGTLGFSDMNNQADYQVEHQSIGISTGGPVGK
ncbi:hemagglutinin repeat-containing protein, partial [Acerihabitans sp. TG2]|uniref:hemagglutinin repeat-containing protein n=1 Tax=Acerihabitans sp. TG2 TaxID=3096008 RepID=UPI002B22BA86